MHPGLWPANTSPAPARDELPGPEHPELDVGLDEAETEEPRNAKVVVEQERSPVKEGDRSDGWGAFGAGDNLHRRGLGRRASS